MQFQYPRRKPDWVAGNWQLASPRRLDYDPMCEFHGDRHITNHRLRLYADDAVLFSDCSTKWPEILTGFDDAAQTMGLQSTHLLDKDEAAKRRLWSWPVFSVYEGHVQLRSQNVLRTSAVTDSSGRSTPGVLTIYSGVLVYTCKYNGQVDQWLVAAQSEPDYNALVVSVLSYGAETWTLLQSDGRKLEAFHMSSHRHILGVRWYNYIPNTVIAQRTWGHNSLGPTQPNSQETSGDIWTVDTFDVFLKLLQLTLPWSRSSTHTQAVHLTMEHHGGDLAVSHDTPGCDNYRRRHWTHRWQPVDYCQWPWSLEGFTTYRWSSGSMCERVILLLPLVVASGLQARSQGEAKGAVHPR